MSLRRAHLSHGSGLVIGSNGVCYGLFATPKAKQRLIAMLTEVRTVLAQLSPRINDE